MSEQDVIVQDALPPVERTVDVITGEILEISRQYQSFSLSCAVEIGRRLTEVKATLEHGEWGEWLKERVKYSQSTANNLMRLFREYGSEQVAFFGVLSNSQTFGNLTYTKALQLLAVPEEERQSFMEEHPVDEMTVRELEKAIKERDEAQRKRDDLEEKYFSLHKTSQELAARVEEDKLKIAELEKSKEQAKKQYNGTKQLKALEKELAEQKKKLAESDRQLAEQKKQLAAAKQAPEPDLGVIQKYEDEIERLKKQVTMSDADITEFRMLFDSVQAELVRLGAIIQRVETFDAEKAAKFRQALSALAEQLKQ